MKKTFAFLIVLSVAAAAFAPGCRKGPSVSFVLGSTVHTLNVEIADEPHEMERGLMHRESLPHDRGMLFDFGKEVETAFWMKDTEIPLSIAFIGSDGKVLAIKDMAPYDLTAVNPPGAYRYAVETNRGWFQENGINPGTRVSLNI